MIVTLSLLLNFLISSLYELTLIWVGIRGLFCLGLKFPLSKARQNYAKNVNFGS